MSTPRRGRRRELPRGDARALKALLVPADASLQRVLAAIERGGIELAFVADARERVIGTLSDGDVRRALLAGVPLDESGAARDAMCEQFTHVDPDTPRAEVLDRMRAQAISQIPVLDRGGRIVGLHLLRDLIGARERPNCAVIMAGGQGMRLRPYTETLPKPMLTVAGRPILERLVLHLLGYGIRDIFLSIHYLGHVIEEHFGDGSAFGCRIRYLRERKPLGTGGALSLLPKRIKHPVLVMNGDLVTGARIDQILDFHDAGAYALSVCLRPYAVEIPFGVAEVRGDRLVGLREKPTEQMLVNTGIYVVSPQLLSSIPKRREYPITQLAQTCLERELPVGAHVLQDDWIDIGRHDELRRARGQA